MGTVHQLDHKWTLAELPIKVKISEAKEHIKLAEQADQQALEHYVTAGNLLAAANHKDRVSYADLAKGIGKSKAWVVAIVQWFRETDRTQRPFVVASQEKRERAKQSIGQAPDRLKVVQAPGRSKPQVSQNVTPTTKAKPATKIKRGDNMKDDINRMLTKTNTILDLAKSIESDFKTITATYGKEIPDDAKDAIINNFYVVGEVLSKLAQQVEGE